MGSSRQKPARLGEKLMATREKCGLSLSEMARALSDEKASVRRQDLFRFEKNERDPPLIVLLRYSKIAGVPMEIFADDDLDLPF